MKTEKFKVDFSASNALKLCAKNNIAVLSVKKLGASACEIEIEKSYRKAFCKCFKIKQIKLNYVALVSAIFCVLFLVGVIFSTNYVISIKVEAQSPQIESLAREIVESEVNPIVKKSEIDLNKIKNKLLNENQISLCDVKIVGLVLYVSVKENEAIPESDFKPIISTVEGVVQSVNLTSGTALVEKGSYVKVGDVLIAPQMVVDGNIVASRALGEVSILAFSQKSEVFLENRIEYRQTGRVFSQKYFTIFNNAVKINKDTVNFSTYEKTVSTKKSKLGFIPIKIFVENFYETEAVDIKINFEEVKNIEEQRVLTELKSEVGDTAIYSENVQHKLLSSGVYEIVATVQYLITIGI